MKTMTEPCKQCPFTTKSSPELMAQYNSTPERFIGQAYGPFLLPCHLHKTFTEGKFQDGPQCPGAAMFRANVGVAQMLPEALLRLPPSDKVFGSPAELLAHNKGITIEQAKQELLEHPVTEHLRTELNHQRLRFFPINKKEIA